MDNLGDFLFGVLIGLFIVFGLPVIWDCLTGKGKFRCRYCKHPKSKHNGKSGPNSNGQWSHGECREGAKSYPPYSSGGCTCINFKRSILPRRHHART